ncbi:MAG: threonine/serine dehydratase [Clostridia bacterium]|nr:threonine/serine dehydratase [Clostridia bacterium]
MDEFKQYPVSLQEVIRAQRIIKSYLKPTQLNHYARMSKDCGMDIFIKHENHHPTGSFKIRGGVNIMHHLRKAGVKGVITFSTGNHGLSVAASAHWFGLDATIVVPENNNPAKNELIRSFGAKLLEAGKNFDEASKVVDQLSRQEELYYIHPANEPHLINGVGSEFLEILEDLPDIDVMIVPIGGGSEAAAAVTVLKTINPKIQVIAVQAKASSAAYCSWKANEIRTGENKTFAGGFATGKAYEIPFGIYSKKLDHFVLLDEDEIVQGIALAMYYTKNLAEGAGASTIMAALKLREVLKGKKVVLQMSGCNASSEEVSQAIKSPCFEHGTAGRN